MLRRLGWFYLSCLAAFTAGHMINYGVIIYAQEVIRADLLSGLAFGLCFGPPLLLGWPAGALCDRLAPGRLIHAAQASFFVAALLLWWGFLWTVQRRLLFPAPLTAGAPAMPRDAEAVWLDGADGKSEAWLLRPPGGAGPAPLVIFTTPVDNMVTGLVRARVPYKIAFIFAATLRFFPLLLKDIGAIIDAQRLRGIALEKMSLLGRIRIYARVAVPLCLGAMVRSQQLEVVLQAKAFSGSADRTYLHEPRLRTADVLLMLSSGAFVVGAFVFYYWKGFGRFTGAW